MTDRVNELAAVSLRKPVKIFVDSNKTVAWNLQQEFVRVRPNQEAHQVGCDSLDSFFHHIEVKNTPTNKLRLEFSTLKRVLFSFDDFTF